MKQLLLEMGKGSGKGITIKVDNKRTIKLAEQRVTLARSKHIGIRHHFNRDIIEA